MAGDCLQKTALLKNERNVCLIVQNVHVKIAEHICPSVLYGGGHKHPGSMLWRQLPSNKQTCSKIKEKKYLSNFVKCIFQNAEHICPSVLYGGGHKHRRSMLWRQLPSRSARRVCNLQLPFA